MTVVVDNRGRCRLLFRFGGQGSLTTDMLSQDIDCFIEGSNFHCGPVNSMHF